MEIQVSTKIDRTITDFIANIPELIRRFNYRKGPDLYFYKKTIELRRNKPLIDLFEESDRFIELIYATLACWDMNSRGAKMKYFDDFKASVLSNKERFIGLSYERLETISKGTLGEVKTRLEQIYNNLHLMETGGRLVSNSKVMHFILPDLIMPIDRQNTLNFFYGHTGELEGYFTRIFSYSYEVTQRIDLRQFLDDDWNQSVPKVIDNAIISKMSPKYNNST
jgi:hypothetical protein